MTIDELAAQTDGRLSKLEMVTTYQGEKTDLLLESVQQVRHILIEGNGREPITTRVATIETRLSMMDRRAEARTIPWAVWLSIAVSIALGIAGLIIK